MTVVPVAIEFGNSLTEGLANLNDVPSADMTRWTGAVFPSTNPTSVQVPGVRVHTPRLPFATSDDRSILASTATTIQFSGVVLGAAQIGQWIYIDTAAVGQGQHAQVSAGTGTDTLTVVTSFATTPSTTGTMSFLTNSHTLTGAQTSTVLTKTAATASLAAVTAGTWFMVINRTGTGAANQARRVVSTTADTVTVNVPFTTVPIAGDGIVILDGSTAVVGSIATYVAANTSVQPLTFSLDGRQVYDTGNDYPNFSGFPWQSPFVNDTINQVNATPELSWQLRNFFDEPIHTLTLGIRTSTLSPNYIGTTMQASTFSWLHDVVNNDWHPASTNGYLDVLKAAITAFMADITAEGNTGNIVGIFTNLVEVDSNDRQRADRVGVNMRLLMADLRTWIATNGYSQSNAKLIPWVNCGAASSLWPYRDDANAALLEIEGEDVNCGYVDTTGSDYSFGIDGIHLDAAGQIVRGRAMYERWSWVRTRAQDATRLAAELPTLTALRAQVRSRYERTGSSADARTELLDQFINDSLREVYNTLGDNAWPLRRVEQCTLSTAYPGTIVLPYLVKRLLRIESLADPGRQVTWKGVSLQQNGRMQIALHDWSGTTFVVHFISIPKDLVSATDVAIIPNDYIELLVLLVCKRLAEATGNSTIAAYYGIECERIWRYVKKDALRYQRMYQEAITVDGYSTLDNGLPKPSSWGA